MAACYCWGCLWRLCAQLWESAAGWLRPGCLACYALDFGSQQLSCGTVAYLVQFVEQNPCNLNRLRSSARQGGSAAPEPREMDELLLHVFHVCLQILNQFGEVQPDLLEKQRYAAWRAADINKAIKEGRTPAPPAPKQAVNQEDQALLDSLGGAPSAGDQYLLIIVNFESEGDSLEIGLLQPVVSTVQSWMLSAYTAAAARRKLNW